MCYQLVITLMTKLTIGNRKQYIFRIVTEMTSKSWSQGGLCNIKVLLFDFIFFIVDIHRGKISLCMKTNLSSKYFTNREFSIYYKHCRIVYFTLFLQLNLEAFFFLLFVWFPKQVHHLKVLSRNKCLESACSCQKFLPVAKNTLNCITSLMFNFLTFTSLENG